MWASVATSITYTISDDGKSATSSTESSWGGGYASAYFSLDFDADVVPGAFLTGGLSKVIVDETTLAQGNINAQVAGQVAIPAGTGAALPGEATNEFRLYSATVTKGSMTLTAPTGTTFDSVRVENGALLTISADRKTATGPSSYYGGANGDVYVKLKIDAGATPGATLTGGTAVVVNAGVIQATGTITATVETAVVIAPVDITGPNDSVFSNRAPVTGTGENGAVVTLKKGTTTLGTTTVVDGKWSITPTTDWTEGNNDVTATQVIGTSTTTANHTLKLIVVTPVVVTGPAENSIVAPGNTVFSGTGHDGATVEVRGTSGRVIATGTVVAGKWTATSTIALDVNDFRFTAYQIVAGAPAETSSTVFFKVRVVDAPMTQVTVTTPAKDEVVNVHKPVFTGEGQPGARILIHGTTKDICSTTVPANGKWSCTSDIKLASGMPYLFNATQSLDGHKTNTTQVLFKVQYEATLTLEVTSPANNSVVNTKRPTFTGKGDPGAQIRVGGTSKTVCTTTVSTDGAWSCTPDFDLATDMSYILTIKQTDHFGSVQEITASLMVAANAR